MAGEAILSFAAEEILKKLVSRATEEISTAWGMKGELEKLRGKLELIQNVSSDAARRQVREAAVGVWLKKLKSVAYRAEDVLDEFAFETLRRKLELQNRMKKEMRNFFSLSNPIAFRFKMAHKVKNVNMKLEDIYREASDVLKLQILVLGSTSATTDHGEIRRTHPFVGDLEVVGRDADRLDVVKFLSSNDEEDMSIVAIVGMAGLGKTTLAQKVYENEKMMNYFDERMWVCFSDIFDVGKLLKEMIESLTKASTEMSNLEAMVKILQDRLKGKKFLLVLDDVWTKNLEAWEPMRSSLLGIGASRGSKILVTTRSDEVIPIVKALHTHNLAGLSIDEGWGIFEQKAFARGGANKTSKLEDIGRRIVGKCKGVPLAIKTLGALAYSKKHEHEWLLILKGATWEDTILPILKLSFDNLPSPLLKQCFAYCSIFSQDSNIEKDDLIQLWMAQGYLQPSPESSLLMEDIGSECFVLEAGKENDNLEARHLSLKSNKESGPTISKGRARILRTLFSGIDVFGNTSLKFKCLHSLSLYEADIEELPSSISKLIHLRYLDLSKTKIRRFLRSFAKLYNLQTLRLISCYYLEELPQDLRNMVSLRHLYTFKQLNKMPKEMGKLTNLQTLPIFVVGLERGCHIEELGCLEELRGELTIYNLEQVWDKEAAKRANLPRKSYLYKLGFVWKDRGEGEGSNNDEDVLEGLQPHPNLKSLKIVNFRGGKFASWLQSMSISSSSHDASTQLNNLVELRLQNCKKCVKIPTLGQLPSLKILEIHGMKNVKCIGAEFYSSNKDGAGSSSAGSETTTLFPALTRFDLKDMHNLVEVTAGPGVVFPCLKVLIIGDCPKLKTAPSHFPFLKELNIQGIKSNIPLAMICSKLTTLTSLDIINVSELSILPEEILQNNTNLESLTIRDCDELISIVPHQHLVLGCTSLQSLDIYSCKKLSYLWEGLYPLTSLETSEIDSCQSLTSIPSVNGFASLRRLEIGMCDGLTSLPSELQSCTCLESFSIWNCNNLVSVAAEDLQQLHSLVSLDISYCGKLECFAEESLGCLTRLKELEIGGFSEKLEAFPGLKSIQHLSLEDLKLRGWDRLKSLPDQLQNLTSLKYLAIRDFNEVEALPEWLGNLSSLETLDIGSCENLMYLPTLEAMRRLTKLKLLLIFGCPKLKERCRRGIGPEWSKISHIPSVKIVD